MFLILSLFFLLLVGVSLIRYYVEEKRNRNVSPPGPWPIPLLGNTIQIAMASSESHLAFSKLSEKYGDIFRVKLGEYEHSGGIFVLTSTEAIMEVFQKAETEGRTAVGVLDIRKGNLESGLGMAWSEGTFWAKKRAWTLRKLRESGFGKSSPLEMNTKHEIQTLIEDWDSQLANNKFVILEVSGLFLLPITKIMWKLMIGRLNEEDQSMMKKFFQLNKAAMAKASAAGITLIAPTISKYLFPLQTGYTAMHNLVTEMKLQSKKYLTEFSKLPTNLTGTMNIVHEYARQMKKFPKDFFEEDFAILFLDLMQGGSDTTSSLLEYLMLYMILCPDVQEKVLQEIEKVLPEGQDATVEDMDRMLYTQATILEAQRFGKIVPLLVPKRITQDFCYRNYVFKKDTTLLGDLFTAFHTGEFEKDSWNFVPERYLKKNADDLWEWNGLQKKIVCFGYGRRICPGQRMTEIVSFVTFVTIVRRYKLFVVPNEPAPKQTQIVGFTANIQPFRMGICLRKENNKQN